MYNNSSTQKFEVIMMVSAIIQVHKNIMKEFGTNTPYYNTGYEYKK